MQAGTSDTSQNGRVLQNPPEFSLVLGGPLYQLLRRAHLSDDALSMIRRRVIICIILAWLPLLLLSALEGRFYGDATVVPFLLDAEVHIRFLVTMPLLLVAELVVHRRMRPLLLQFVERKLVPGEALAKFDAAIASAFRLRNSVLAEVLLVAFVYGVGILVIWRYYLALETSTWYATPSPEGASLSIAGIWYGYVSLPLFQFLLCRWYFRLFIWVRFLWQVSRIELSIVAGHPDHLGGMGFISGQVYAFAMLAVAHGSMLAGTLANRIFFVGASLLDFKAEIAIMVVFMMCVLFGPLLFFSPQLAAAKRKGSRAYGVLAERYTREFEAKWLRERLPENEPLLGNSDFQSQADLGNSFASVQSMRIVPVKRDDVLRLAVVTLAPLVPLALTMMPLEELLKTLFGVLF